MRNNQPITQIEYRLPSDSLLVSHTDLQGNITYANESFIEASGFDFGELMGQPHNLLRHPDVPQQVFADFWATLQAGKPWHQIVKNRRKNGDYYWVEANATPIIENNQITGYMSVRTPATQAQIQSAEQAYQAVHDGKITLRQGVVDSIFSRLNLFAHWNPLWTIIPATLLALAAEVNAFLFDLRPGWLNNLVIFMTIVSTFHVMYFIRRIRDAIEAVDHISNGELNHDINTFGSNTAGEVNRRIKTMQIRLGAQKNDIVTNARRSSRLEAGLDNLNANILLSDQNGTITYFNDSLKCFLRNLEPQIQAEVPDFDLNNLLGKSTGCLFKQDDHLLAAVFNLKTSESFKFEFFGAQIQLQMTPILDEQGKKLGVVIEWQDIFQEIYVQQSIKQLVEDAKNGKLSSRLESDQLTGFYHDLSEDINGLMANLQSTLKDMSIIIGGLSTKDLTIQAQGTHHGQYDWTISSLVSGIHSLRDSFCKVNNQASEVTQSAEHVAKSNELLSNSIQSQARELQKTSSAMRQLTHKVNETAQQANVSNDLAQQTQKEVVLGNESMQETISAMHEISEVSGKITGIVTLIDSIAFQTNLLALNAAVEAARAGDHGRGFAVVAGEVRSLAQKSAEAAREIKILIDTTAQKIDQGRQKVQTTGDNLGSIIQQVDQMTNNIAAISENAQEQSAQINEVNDSIKNIDESANHNATLVLENSSLAEYLGDVASSMDELVGSFDLGDCKGLHDVTAETHADAFILVVDDNIANQKVAEILLNRLGYATQLASNGRDAIAQCKQHHPMAILMDIEMPIMDGLIATQQLRQSGYQNPIIAYTGHSDDFNEQTSAAGMNEVVHKPMKSDDIQGKLLSLGCQPNPKHSVAAKIRREAIIEQSATAQQLSQMIQAHLDWKRKIRTFIDGADIGITYDIAIDHTACSLGKWHHHGTGQNLKDLPLMKKLDAEHLKMHQLIKVIMDASKTDDYQTISQGVSEIDAQSDKVVALLNELIETAA